MNIYRKALKMSSTEKLANLYHKKSMTKKAWKQVCSNDRGEAMPRPVVFVDKRTKVKYKPKYDV